MIDLDVYLATLLVSNVNMVLRVKVPSANTKQRVK